MPIDDQQSDSPPTMVPCNISIGRFKLAFAVTSDAASELTSDLQKVIARYGEFIDWQIAAPPRRRNKARGDHVVAREQLVALKRAGELPPEVDATIPWITGDDGQITLPKRGQMNRPTREAYWELVKRGVITNPIPRPVAKRTKSQ